MILERGSFMVQAIVSSAAATNVPSGGSALVRLLLSRAMGCGTRRRGIHKMYTLIFRTDPRKSEKEKAKTEICTMLYFYFCHLAATTELVAEAFACVAMVMSSCECSSGKRVGKGTSCNRALPVHSYKILYTPLFPGISAMAGEFQERGGERLRSRRCGERIGVIPG